MDIRILEIKVLVEQILRVLGIPTTVSTQDTPERVAKMYVNELFSSLAPGALEDLKGRMTCFPNEGRGLIIIKGITFNSICEHHLMPFSGVVNVGYMPNDKIIGLSKIPRVVKFFSRKPQLQERYTKEIAEFLMDTLNSIFLTVTVKATHACVMCRGAESDCQTITVYTLGDREGEKLFAERGGFDFADKI